MRALRTDDSISSTVVVADANPEERAAMAQVFAHIGYVVAQATGGTEAIELARRLHPEAIIVDVALPEISGYQICNLLRIELGQDVGIFLVSAGPVESHDRAAALLLGATDYLPKTATDELLARMRASYRRPPQAADDAPSLTPSELRVLELLAAGLRPPAISDALSVSPKTTSMHIQNAMKKLEVHSRTEAVALAFRLGLVDGNGARVSDRPRTPASLEDSLRPSAGRRARARQR